MELKLGITYQPDMVDYLLIVPYGIETLLKEVLILISILLLIVPYGIET